MVFIKWWGWKHDLCGNDATANGNDDDNVISEGEGTQQFVEGGRGLVSAIGSQRQCKIIIMLYTS